jgi:hypothetical protein
MDATNYRNRAENCRRLARGRFAPFERDAWVELARQWERLAQQAEAGSAPEEAQARHHPLDHHPQHRARRAS